MTTRTQKIIIGLIFLFTFIIIGLFFAARKSASSETQGNSQNKLVTVQSGEPLRILFTGDMMFDRYIRQSSEKRGDDFVFAGTKDVLMQNDLVVGNLEGPVTNNSSVSVNSEFGSRNNYIFTFAEKIAQNLGNNNIKMVNLGNNHIYNFGEDGLSQTKQNLKNADIDFVGDPSGEKRIAYFQKKGTSVAFVTYNQFESDAKNKTLADIAIAKKNGVNTIILYTHWGQEYLPNPSEGIKSLGHEFVDAGVDLIIGSHPHVTQPSEEYKGKMIYYSLGNFIFDQYFSSQTQQGLLVQIEIDPTMKKITTKDIRVTLKNSGQTILEK
jgi:poly-gamma-glutamate synthesis protein (capsule biosynthesis protein)